MANTDNLQMPLIDANQSQKQVTHNLALEILDIVVQMSPQAIVNTPPGSPTNGQCWIIGTSPSGVFAGKANQIAAWQDGSWSYLAPVAGWNAIIQADYSIQIYTGSAWVNRSTKSAVPSYTVSALPTPGTAGREAFATNGRMFNGTGTLESASAGTGGLVVDNGTAWKIAGTNVTVSA